MKATFYNLDEEKRRRIENAALEEFGTWGYERGSTDRIIRRSGISKGGLYEYIESKEDLFLHILEIAFGALYDYIGAELRAHGGPPEKLTDRVMASSTAALHFYLANPPVVRLIASLAAMNDPDAKAAADLISGRRFHELFDGADFAAVGYPKERVLELLRWLLVKTRNDFIADQERLADTEALSKAYLADWNFLLSVLDGGIYTVKEH